MNAVRTLFCFIIAGLCEIGGGYLFWLWLREDRSSLFAVGGGAIGLRVAVAFGVVLGRGVGVVDFGRVGIGGGHAGGFILVRGERWASLVLLDHR